MAVGKGVHAFSIYGTAVVDYALTIALAVMITAWTKVPLVLTTIVCMIAAVVVHAAAGTDTRTMRWIKRALDGARP
jgi:hypothetical protein